MKPAAQRPRALRDQQGEVRYYRREGGTRLAVRAANATNDAVDQIEPEPGMGSPTLGKILGTPGLRTWRVKKFPLLWFYFEREDHLDVVRLLGERQHVVAILGDEFASNQPHLNGRRRKAVAQCPVNCGLFDGPSHRTPPQKPQSRYTRGLP